MYWFINQIFDHYADFTGRTCRKDYWMFMLWYCLLLALVGLLDVDVIGALFSFFLTIPSLAISVRRFHDLNMSGWRMLIIPAPLLLLPFFWWLSLVPFVNMLFMLTLGIGFFAVMIFFTMKGTVGPNRFGPDPLTENNLSASQK